MKKTYLVAPLLILQFVCYCKIFHNLTHKVNNPYLLDKNWMIALTVGLLGFALAKIIDGMMKPRHKTTRTTEVTTTIDNGSKTSRFFKTAFFIAVPIILGSFMLNYLINPDSLKALDHAQNSTKAFFIVYSIGVAIGVAIAALFVVVALLACCCCCCLLAGSKSQLNNATKNQLENVIDDARNNMSSNPEQPSTSEQTNIATNQNNSLQQPLSSELSSYDNLPPPPYEEPSPAYNAINFQQQVKNLGISVLKSII